MNKKTAALIAIFSFVFLISYNTEVVDEAKRIEEDRAKQKIEKINNIFGDLSIEAKSVGVFDVSKNEIVFGLDADRKLPLASLTKIMTAIIAKENIPEYFLVNIPVEAILHEGDSGFNLNEKWKIDDLIDVMLISSSNDAAAALAMSFDGEMDEFVSLMNKKAEEIGLTQTFFSNPTGLDVSETIAGAYSSVRDISGLIKYVMEKHPYLLEITQYDSLQMGGRIFKNTNKLAEELPGTIISKTGFSDLAGGNLAMVTDIGLERPIIIVALGSSEKGRFEDVKTLYEATARYLND